MSVPVAPDPVDNCTVINTSSETFYLQCVPGFDGGMDQSFIITVTDSNTNAVVYNASIDGHPSTHEAKGAVAASAKAAAAAAAGGGGGKNPLGNVFVQNLSAGHTYLASVTPYNKKGFGQTKHVVVNTLSHPAVELTQVKTIF